MPPIDYSLMLFHSVLLFVTFWAESSLHGSITGEASKVLNATDDIGAAVDGLVLFVEQKRYVWTNWNERHTKRYPYANGGRWGGGGGITYGTGPEAAFLHPTTPPLCGDF